MCYIIWSTIPFMASLSNSWNLILAKGSLKPDSLYWSNSILEFQAFLGIALWDCTFSTGFFLRRFNRNNIIQTDHKNYVNFDIRSGKWPYSVKKGIFMLLQLSVSKILAHRRLWYFKTTKILQKWLQTWFVLLHLALVWNVRIKTI